MQAVADAAFLLDGLTGQGGALEVRVNGRTAKTVPLTVQLDPVEIDISTLLAPGANQAEFIPSAGAASAVVQVVATHWMPWSATLPRSAKHLRLGVEFDRTFAKTGESIRCRVRAGSAGSGMLLAEIGLPPGAEVDRASLERVRQDSELGVSRYDVLPDRVLFYLWPKADGASFSFDFRPRIAMQAKSGPSLLYDYYNPDAMTEISPAAFRIE
jgi:hypothetical protein